MKLSHETHMHSLGKEEIFYASNQTVETVANMLQSFKAETEQKK
jgi:hypothetical protein